MGYSDGTVLRSRWAGSGNIWLDDGTCSGSELYLQNCPHRPWGMHNCGHAEDVALRCFDATTLPMQETTTVPGDTTTGELLSAGIALQQSAVCSGVG